MNGNLKAEGGYSFVDLNNDKNTVLNGEVTTYYQNGKEKLHGRYVNGKREGLLHTPAPRRWRSYRSLPERQVKVRLLHGDAL